jgi:hypothetical protein
MPLFPNPPQASDGGAATAAASATSQQTASATAIATGGTGVLYGSAIASASANTTLAGGNASASASAEGANSAANAIAQSIGSGIASASARSAGTAPSLAQSTTFASGSSNHVIVGSQSTTALIPTSQTQSTFGGKSFALPNVALLSFSSVNFANAIGSPNATIVASVLAGHPNVTQVFTPSVSVLGVGYTGASLGFVPSGQPLTPVSSTTEYDFQFKSPQAIYLGLLDNSSSATGLQSISLSVTENGRVVASESFTGASAASNAAAYFEDHPLYLGSFNGGLLDLGISTHIVFSGVGGFDYSYAVGAGALQSVAAVPEPSTWLGWACGIGVMAMLGSRRRTQRMPAIACQ